MDKDKIKELLKEHNNTRNFSNIYTKFGKTIRPDIIRSNIITSKEQTSTLINNDIKTIIDLRIREEGGGNSKHPIYPDAIINFLPIAFGSLDLKIISELLIKGENKKIESFIENGYRTFSSDFKPEIKSFFSLLLNKDNLPMAFHCSAGKDRTGIFSALFLIALGVTRNEVINDFMETNNRINIKNLSEKIDEHLKLMLSVNGEHSKNSAKGFEILFMVKRSWIEIFLQGTDESFGSVESYLKHEINLDMERLKKIYIN